MKVILTNKTHLRTPRKKIAHALVKFVESLPYTIDEVKYTYVFETEFDIYIDGVIFCDTCAFSFDGYYSKAFEDFTATSMNKFAEQIVFRNTMD